MKNKHILLIITLFLSLPSLAQELWTSAGMKMDFGKTWGLNAEVEYRTHNGLSSTERITFGVGGEYKMKHFKFDAGYKYLEGHTLDETTKKNNIIPAYWIGRHRAYVSAVGKLKLGRFEFSLRERYQYTHRLGKWVPKYAADGVTAKDDEWVSPKDRHILRSRLACDWNIRKSRFTPFASVEFYDDLSSKFALEKIRYTLGTDIKLNKKNRLEVFYRFVQGIETGTENIHAIGIGYSFRLQK